MKNYFLCLVAFCLFFLLASGAAAGSQRDSAMELFSKVEKIPYDLMYQVDSLANNNIDIDNEIVKQIIINLLAGIATKEFSREWENKIDSGLAAGNKLARCSEFDWAIPSMESQYYVVSEVRITQEQAIFICLGKIPDLLSAYENNSADINADSVSLYPQIKNPWSRKYQGIKWVAEYSATFFFLKTSLGWKFSGFNIQF